jgi:hypothetical protein
VRHLLTCLGALDGLVSRAHAAAIWRSAPQARQIVDRWHLIKNVREVVQRVAARHRDARQAAAYPAPAPDARAAPQTSAPEAEPDPAPLTPRQAERNEYFHLPMLLVDAVLGSETGAIASHA